MTRDGLGELLERSEELGRIAACAEAVAGGEGRVLVVEGPAGIGKTALVAAAEEHARDAGLRAFTARGTELERAFGFGVVRQLFEPVVQDGDHAPFEGAARRAAALLDMELAEPAYLPLGPEGSFAALHGLYRLTANLAPLALLVDDAHWADGASRRFLAYLANRIGQLPVLLVVAARPLGEPGGAAVAETLADAMLLRPEALSGAGSEELLRAAVPEAAVPLCRTCHELTGGNPFFLRELSDALREAGAERAGDVLAAAPEGVVASVRARLARFPHPAKKLAGAAAIVGDGGLVRHAATLAGLDDGQAAQAADTLRAGRILAHTRALRFVHPIIRSAVYGQLPAATRSDGHGRAARMLAEEDGAPDRVGAHLLATEPSSSPWVCDRLRDAARKAVPRGAPDAAVTYLRRALEEPPPAADRPATLLELGLAESLTLDRGPAIEHLRRGVETTQDTVARLYAARTLGAMVGMDSPSQAVELVERALAAGPDADPALALHIEGHMLSMARWAVDSRRATFDRAARLCERVRAGEVDGPMELTAAAQVVAMSGESAELAAALAERAIEGLRGDPIVAVVIGFAVQCLTMADRLDRADEILTATIDEAQRARANYRVGPLLALRSDARFRIGALRDAAADAEAARHSYAHAGRLAVLGAATALAQALIELGEPEAAEEALAAGGEIGEAYSGTLLTIVRARLRLVQGDAEAALADALEAGRRQEAMREHNPAIVDWRSQAALAHAALGRPDAGLPLARQELELARRFGAPRAIGVALRTVGVLAGELEPLEAAAAVLGGSQARLQHAHALAELGVALRHRRRAVEAREPLRQALDIAVRCDAAPLAERARTELLIAGGRPRRTELSGVAALTTNERRVAAMAAEGRSNREIAQELYVSHKTVEKHLSAAYRKLDVGGREELPTALARE